MGPARFHCVVAETSEIMAANIKAPPSLSKSSSYISWLKEIEIWQTFTDLEATKQGPAIFLSLEGRARDAVLELEVKQISAADGVDKIIKKLNALYMKDKTQSAYEAYDSFESFKRPNNMPIDEFINEFERLKSRTESYGTSLSSDVLAFRVLKSANLSQAHEQLAKATISDLKYDLMVTQLKKIFSDVTCSSSGSSSVEVKMEPTFHCCGSGNDVCGNIQQSFYGNTNKKGFNKSFMPKPNSSRQNNNYKQKKKGRNPLNEKGEVTRCVICESVNHWASNCPDKVYYSEDQVEDSAEEEPSHQVTLFQSNLITNSQMKVFVSETLNTAVLDSGATANVAGQTWINCYIDSLSNTDRNKVEQYESKASFKFGSDKVFPSLGKIRFPATIGSRHIFIETDVVDTHVPLLLSKEAMKKADTLINFTDDSVTMFGEVQNVYFTKSGHYAVALDDKRKILQDVCKNEIKIILKVDTVDKDDKKAIAHKLHCQFVHPPVEKLVKLISLAGLGDDSSLIRALKEVSHDCKLCKEFRKAPPRPIVAMPLANSFNEVVAMDLKKFKGRWVLHLIDHLTRFSAASYVSSKEPQEIIKKIFKIWVAVFGPPRKFLSDNAGEFINKEFVELCQSFNIVVKTTAAEAP